MSKANEVADEKQTGKAIKKSKIKIVRQKGTNNFYVSWGLTSGQKTIVIDKKVYSNGNITAQHKKYHTVISNYTVIWWYGVSGSKKWYQDKKITTSKTETSNDLWTPPDNAVKIRVSIKPNSKEYKSSKSKKSKWFTVKATYKTDYDYDEYPSAPSISEFNITGKTLKATVSFDTVTNDIDKVRLQVLQDGSKYVSFSGSSAVAKGGKQYIEKSYTGTAGQVIFTATLLTTAGYQVRARVATKDDSASKGTLWSEYSEWSSSTDTRPYSPSGVTCVAMGADKIKVSWNKSVKTATQYEIEYVTDNSDYFEGNMVSSVTVDGGGTTSYIVSGLESGHTYYFRVRSVNDADKSDPSKPVAAILATKPAAPITWSSTTTGVVGGEADSTEPLYIYWSHNSQDGSAQRNAKLEFLISGITFYLLKENTETDEVTGDLIDKVTELNLWDIVVYRNSDGMSNPAGTIFSLFTAGNGETIKWKVRTKGIHNDYSDWSTERLINAYIRPNLDIVVADSGGDPLVDNVLNSFPLLIKGTATPYSQTPISYHISIEAGTTYESNDIYGDQVTIVEGTEIYSVYLDTSEQLNHTISASDVDFLSDVNYILKVLVFMDSGLTAEASYEFVPSWDEIAVTPDADIMYNDTYRFTDIRPFSQTYIGYTNDDDDEIASVAYFGTSINGTSEEPTIFSGSGIVNASTGDMYFNKSNYRVYTCVIGGNAATATWMYRTTFDYSDALSWYSGTSVSLDSASMIFPYSGVSEAQRNDYYFNTESGDIFKCKKAGMPTEAEWEYVWNCFWMTTPNCTLSVYRREANGSYVAIKEGIDNDLQSSDSAITVRDYHPSFGTCVYRIVSTDIETGAMAYEDIVENYQESSVIIQWDEVWRNQNEDEDDETEVDAEEFSGSILEIPANVKLSDSNNKDVTLAEYIGRTRPVSYYGTQRGENPSISCEFPKSDTETLALLRRLMVYQGDVYIREPSGLGYWANVSVSYNRDYKSLTVPVTINIKPVEGGV